MVSVFTLRIDLPGPIFQVTELPSVWPTPRFSTNINRVRNTLQAATRVQAHRMKLEKVRREQGEKVHLINLPFEVQRTFFRRDDWGRDNRTEGMEIGIYTHEDPALNSLNRHVYVLHIELAAVQHGHVDPVSPGSYGGA